LRFRNNWASFVPEKNPFHRSHVHWLISRFQHGNRNLEKKSKGCFASKGKEPHRAKYFFAQEILFNCALHSAAVQSLWKPAPLLKGGLQSWTPSLASNRNYCCKEQYANGKSFGNLLQVCIYPQTQQRGELSFLSIIYLLLIPWWSTFQDLVLSESIFRSIGAEYEAERARQMLI